jgi:hypothetical protein
MLTTMLTITKGRSAELQTCRAPVDSQAATNAVDEFVKKVIVFSFSPSPLYAPQLQTHYL